MNAPLAALAISHIDLLSTRKKEVVFFFSHCWEADISENQLVQV